MGLALILQLGRQVGAGCIDILVEQCLDECLRRRFWCSVVVLPDVVPSYCKRDYERQRNNEPYRYQNCLAGLLCWLLRSCHQSLTIKCSQQGDNPPTEVGDYMAQSSKRMVGV